VFLDEIAEIPLELQAKLLAVLERRSLRRVGSSQERRVPAWLIAATNRDVEAMVDEGSLRSDLYFRLNVLTLALPPLRERGDDAVLLAGHFAREVARRYGFDEPQLGADARRAIAAYPWPGNVRELSHVIERALLLCGGAALDAAALGLRTPEATTAAADLAALDDMTLEEIEQFMIRRALARCDDNVSEAARRLGITRMAMRYRMQKYGIASGAREQ